MRLDPQPFSRQGTATIVIVAGLLLAHAGLVLVSLNAASATNLQSVVMIFRQIGLSGGVQPLLVSVLVAAILMALAGALLRLGWVRLCLLMPIHFLLGTMAWGSILTVYRGSYLDGTVIPWQHIAADQSSYPALFLIYTFAILRRSSDPDG